MIASKIYSQKKMRRYKETALLRTTRVIIAVKRRQSTRRVSRIRL